MNKAVRFEEIIDAACEAHECGETGLERCLELYFEELRDKILDYAELQGALNAGIPLDVALGKKKLSDYFSKEYIELQCKRGGEK